MDIYVGNLSYDATDEDLRQQFETYGNVSSARVIVDRNSGRSKGFGFVEMPDRSEAENAVNSSNGVDMMGRPLRVNEAQPRPQGGGGGGRRGGGGFDRGDRGHRGDRGDRNRW